jgi:two-component system, LytTR family, sensor histidine kinase AlgZ
MASRDSHALLSPALHGSEGLFLSTARALAAPRRLVPILAIAVPIVLAQSSFSRDPLAVPLAIAMCLLFVVLAPVTWRILFPPEGRPESALRRGLLYGAVGFVTVAGLGAGVPHALGMGTTFLTVQGSLLIGLAFFYVGGWGLGRDIDFEASLARERARAAELGREAERAQLLALRSHLDPHFLFNTLNAIAEWCREDGEVAERAILELSSMLRTMMEGVRVAAWPLSREIDLVRTLFALHLIRDASRFSLACAVSDDAARLMVPPLILLPLAENAMKHGPAKGFRGEVRLTGSVRGGMLHVELENPGAWGGHREGGSGLEMVRKRLDLAYDGRARLLIQSEGERTAIEVVAPRAPPRAGEAA